MSNDDSPAASASRSDDHLRLHDAAAPPTLPQSKTGPDPVAHRPGAKWPRPVHESMTERHAFPSEPSFADLLGRAVANKLEKDPSLLRVPLENIDRWLADRVLSSPDWFVRWRELLECARSDATALRRVLELLRSDTEEARRWRDFSPFAGVLSSAERRKIIRQCSYSH